MREYKDRQNSQKTAFHKDRFFVPNVLKRGEVSEDELFFTHVEEFKKALDVKEAYIQADQLVVYIDAKDNVQALKKSKELGYEVLSELSAIDFIASKDGFEVFYQLLSMQNNKRMRIKCFLPKHEELKSVEAIYKSANWAEREMYDMFGIIIINHPSLKRILMPDDWHGFPLLKTYPLQGDEEAKWYEVDTIFGKEYRDIIGDEERDSAKIDRADTTDFIRINHLVPKGAKPSNEPTSLQEYQEEGGVVGVSKAKKDRSKIIKGRR